MTANNIVGGSSTGAPALPARTPPPAYSREQSSYNPSTGSGYTPRRPSEETAQQSGAVPEEATKGEGIGQSIKGWLAGIHGTGESIRGGFNAGIDRIFNEPEGVAKNEAVEQAGEHERRSGEFAAATKEREGLNTGR